MKILFSLLLLSHSIMPSTFAATPETVNEYFAGPSEGGLLATKFRAYALRSKDKDGAIWRIKLKMVFPLSGSASIWFFLSLDEAKAMLANCKSYLNSGEEAKQSKADVYEKRIGIIEKLDMVYRMDHIGQFEEFWLSPAGELAAEKSLVLTRDEFTNLTKTLEGALAKAVANQ